MHSSATANPMNHFTKELKKISSKRSKTDEDHIAMAKIEYQASQYRDAKLFPDGANLYMPTENIIACLINAGKKIKHGRGSMKAAVTGILLDDPIGYSLETRWKSYKEMEKDEDSWFQKIVNVQGSKIVRTRVLVPEWKFKVKCELETSICDFDMLQELLVIAGRIIGLGDWRPSSGTPGSYGKFIANAKLVGG
jgi:hypothetical protein|tara:strand:- start:10887 stop:11468 length:582 start_codon:yes stop_codon:yes gene_type:complete